MAKDALNSIPVLSAEGFQCIHRGEISDEGEVLSPCTLTYLYMISLEIIRARSFVLVNSINLPSPRKQIARLRFLVSEVSRLFTHPRLFPSLAAQCRFSAMVGADAELQLSQACKNLLLTNQIRMLREKSRENWTRPIFAGGTKNWENFLMNGAVGTALSSKQTVPKSSFQVIPAVGMRIVGDYENEENQLVSWIQESQIPRGISPAATTLMIDFDKPTPPEQSVPNLRLCQSSCTVLQRPNPYQEYRQLQLDLVHRDAHSLETLGSFIERLEEPTTATPVQTGMFVGPNLFPMITLRQWHPPTRLEDLQFIDQKSAIASE